MQVFRLGMSADLSADGSIHTQTFTRAVQYIEAFIADLPMSIELVVVSDNACNDGALAAADALISNSVHGVVGHFASAAAAAALPVYARQGIPLLLPAATADSLTQEFKNAFRVCPADRQQVERIKFFLIAQKIHCAQWIGETNQQQESLKRAWKSDDNLTISLASTEVGCDILSGRYHNVVKHLQHSSETHPVLLTDDAFHIMLCSDVDTTARPIWVCGFDDHESQKATQSIREWYTNKFNEFPGTYFFETVAAVQHLITSLQLTSQTQLTCLDTVASVVSQTVLGPLSFVEQENPLATYSIWEATSAGFNKLTKE